MSECCYTERATADAMRHVHMHMPKLEECSVSLMGTGCVAFHLRASYLGATILQGPHHVVL